MKVVIMAGGMGVRFSEESNSIPKPMIEIGDQPILWHIMKIYSSYGFNEFIICAGYKQNLIKEWISDYYLCTSDVTFDYSAGGNEIYFHEKQVEPWKITVVNTGQNTQTGGRLKRVRKYIGNDTFMMTYGDGVADINIPSLIDYHRTHGKTCTVSMYNFSKNKGVIEMGSDGLVDVFRERSNSDTELINIGFMVLEPNIFEYIKGDETLFEQEPMSILAKEKELAGFVHKGYWKCLDTNRDKQEIDLLWKSGSAPWKKW